MDLEFYLVRTVDNQNEVYEKCKERNDSWGRTVMARIEYSRDLHASDAIYHQTCSVKFRTGQIVDESPGS